VAALMAASAAATSVALAAATSAAVEPWEIGKPHEV
jgi:hypothetical protein